MPAVAPRRPRPAPAAASARPARAAAKLSKDAYRRRQEAVEAELTRLGLRKSHLELAMGDPRSPANFVELRRITSELADVEVGAGRRRGRVAGARGAGAVSARPGGATPAGPGPAAPPVRIGLTGPIGCGKSTVARWLAAQGVAVVDATRSPAR